MSLNIIRLALLCMLTLSAQGAVAQGSERNNAHLRNDCRLAAQVIRTGHPAPRLGWAYSIIRLCDQSGPTVLAERWANAADTLELAELAGASAQFPTRAIFDATASVVRGPAGREASVYAMAVLVSFVSPQVGLNLQDLRHPRDGRPPRIVSASGGDPIGPGDLGDVCPEVLAVLREASSNSRDPDVRRVASEFVRFLSVGANP